MCCRAKKHTARNPSRSLVLERSDKNLMLRPKRAIFWPKPPEVALTEGYTKDSENAAASLTNHPLLPELQILDGCAEGKFVTTTLLEENNPFHRGCHEPLGIGAVGFHSGLNSCSGRLCTARIFTTSVWPSPLNSKKTLKMDHLIRQLIHMP